MRECSALNMANLAKEVSPYCKKDLLMMLWGEGMYTTFAYRDRGQHVII